MDVRIDWWPQPRQLRALRACGMSAPFESYCGAREAEVVGYGGAAGGGKTDTLLVVGTVGGLVWPGSHWAFFRRTYRELEGAEGAIERSHTLLGSWARWHGGMRKWTLPNGSSLTFHHCHREGDVYSYQGSQWDGLLIDEATHFTEFQVDYLRTRNRATVDGADPLMVMATNPGNVGHLWFKSRFVDAGPPEVPVAVDVQGEPETHTFIPARLSDNLILMKRDPGYEKRLRRQSQDVQRALLEGDWDVFVGQVFKAWRRSTHVVRPFAVPANWIRWRAVDWGYAEPWCCLWFAEHPRGWPTVVYREAYEAGLTDPEQAEKIAVLSARDGKIQRTLADPSMWVKRTVGREAVSSADVYRTHGVPLQKADNDRLGGKRRVDEAIRIGLGRRRPRLLVFETCRNLIRTLPALPYDAVRVEDVDTAAEDHAYDALRYGLSWRVSRRRDPDAGRDVWAGARG